MEDNTKELLVFPQGNLYKVKWIGGGEIPKALSGNFTSRHVAKQAIEFYLSSRKRINKNAKGKLRA